MGQGVAAVRRRIPVIGTLALLLFFVIGCSSMSSPESPTGTSGVAEDSRPGFAPSAPATEAPKAPPQNAPAPDIITTGTVGITVDDPAAAADKLAAATSAAGGRVESREEQTAEDHPLAKLVLRIPSAKLDGVLKDLDQLGVVDSMSISHDDVTADRVDLDARILALQTSVNRLLDLMKEADNTADLLAAESSLTERQAELDGLRGQRAALGDQISYATITVRLSTEPPAARPTGFIGAIHAGWDALVFTARGFAAFVGFLLPWTPVILVLAAAVWGLQKVLRRRKTQ
jgi:Ca-activated chloride channel family protein